VFHSVIRYKFLACPLSTGIERQAVRLNTRKKPVGDGERLTDGRCPLCNPSENVVLKPVKLRSPLSGVLVPNSEVRRLEREFLRNVT